MDLFIYFIFFSYVSLGKTCLVTNVIIIIICQSHSLNYLERVSSVCSVCSAVDYSTFFYFLAVPHWKRAFSKDNYYNNNQQDREKRAKIIKIILMPFITIIPWDIVWNPFKISSENMEYIHWLIRCFSYHRWMDSISETDIYNKFI